MKLYQVAYELVGKLSSSFNTSMFSASESLQGLNNKLKDINSAQKNITGFAKLEEDARKTSVALSDDQLPLILPELEDYSPSKTGSSPLDKAFNWMFPFSAISAKYAAGSKSLVVPSAAICFTFK